MFIKRLRVFFPLFLIAVFLTTLSLQSCTKQSSPTQLSGKTMGTQYHISLVANSSNKQLIPFSELQKNIDLILVEVNRQMSTYQKDSEISLFNKHESSDWFSISPDFLAVVQASQHVSKESKGAFDITIAPIINLWGFGPEVITKIPTSSQIKKTLSHSHYSLLKFRTQPPALQKLDPKVTIDLSAIAKGFAVDKISNYLEAQNFKNYLVEIGGEIQSRGLNSSNEKWRIAIESPDTGRENNTEKINSNLTMIIEVSDKALATSGDYRNYFIKNGARYSHTIDPETGSPIKHQLASVTVMHKSAMMADAYATAIMVLGEAKGKIFATKHNLSINMIIRDGNSYYHWNNFDDVKK